MTSVNDIECTNLQFIYKFKLFVIVKSEEFFNIISVSELVRFRPSAQSRSFGRNTFPLQLQYRGAD